MSPRIEAFFAKFFDIPTLNGLSLTFAAGAINALYLHYWWSAAVLIAVFFYLSSKTVSAFVDLNDRAENLQAARDIAWSHVEWHADRADRAEAALARVEAEIVATPLKPGRIAPAIDRVRIVPADAPGEPIYALGKREPVAYTLPDGTIVNALDATRNDEPVTIRVAHRDDEPRHDRAEDC